MPLYCQSLPVGHLGMPYLLATEVLVQAMPAGDTPKRTHGFTDLMVRYTVAIMLFTF